MISSNDQLWKRVCSQHGFITTRPTSLLLRKVEFTEPCTDCSVKPSSNDCVQLVTDSTTSSHPQSCLPATDHFPAASDDQCFDFQSQSKGYQPLFSYKEMFLNHARIFYKFCGEQLLTASVISGYNNRITAIDYHNGYVATGKQYTVYYLYCYYALVGEGAL